MSSGCKSEVEVAHHAQESYNGKYIEADAWGRGANLCPHFELDKGDGTKRHLYYYHPDLRKVDALSAGSLYL